MSHSPMPAEEVTIGAMDALLNPLRIPGLLVVGTDTEVGKTVIAGAIGGWLRRHRRRVAVCKPVATGCRHTREGLVSQDSELLAHLADTPHPLDLVCPQRYLERLAPALAASRAKVPVDWEAINRAIEIMSQDSEVMVLEGVGGVMTPMDEEHVFLDLIVWLGVSVVVVTRSGPESINHSLLTVNALRRHGARVAGVVVNRYNAEAASVAEETAPRAIEKWGKIPILCIAPEGGGLEKFPPHLPEGVAAAVEAVDWEAIAGL